MRKKVALAKMWADTWSSRGSDCVWQALLIVNLFRGKAETKAIAFRSENSLESEELVKNETNGKGRGRGGKQKHCGEKDSSAVTRLLTQGAHVFHSLS